MSEFHFGSGDAIAVPLATATSTPVPFTGLQEFSIDMKFETKTLYGQKQMPLKIARGKGSIDLTIKNATVNGSIYNEVFFGGSNVTAGQVLAALREAAVAAATVSVANKANFQMDMGVLDAATGKPFKKVAANPAAGQYAVDAGDYSFAAGDAGKALLISYTHVAADNGGSTITLSNQLMGTAPLCKLVYATRFEGKQFMLQLNQVVAPNLKMASKLDDFMIPEITMHAFADAGDVVGLVSLAE